MLLQVVMNGIIAGSIYALVALGFTVIYRTVKFFHLAHGIVYTAGAYLAYSVAKGLLSVTDGQMSMVVWILTVLTGMAGAGILGVAIDRLVYYPLRQGKASNLIFLLASFGVFIFVQNLFALIYSSQVLSLQTGPIKQGYRIVSASITPNQIIILSLSVALMILLWLFVQHTKLGKAMRAVSDDPIAASVVGINPEKMVIMSFGIGSALAGAAGVLISLETNIEPTMGFSVILKGMIASIIGGIGSISGAMFGGFFLGIVENVGIWKIQTGWKDTIAFFILIIFLLLRPGGILGIKTEKE